MGRPSKLTPAVHDWIVAALRTGASLQAAARSLGLDPGTVSRWRSAGRVAYEAAGLEGSAEMSDEELAGLVGDDKVAVVKLYRALLQAEVAPAIDAAVTLMAAIENGNWRLGRFYLRRCGVD